MKPLTPAERRDLRAKAHHLDPVVLVGHHGLTPAVLHEIDLALLKHELVKVRISSDDRAVREAAFAQLATDLECAPVQHVGKVLVLWRPNPDKKKKEAPAPAPKRARKSSRAPRPRRPGPRAPSRHARRRRAAHVRQGPARRRAPRRARGAAPRPPSARRPSAASRRSRPRPSRSRSRPSPIPARRGKRRRRRPARPRSPARNPRRPGRGRRPSPAPGRLRPARGGGARRRSASQSRPAPPVGADARLRVAALTLRRRTHPRSLAITPTAACRSGRARVTLARPLERVNVYVIACALPDNRARLPTSRSFRSTSLRLRRCAASCARNACSRRGPATLYTADWRGGVAATSAAGASSLIAAQPRARRARCVPTASRCGATARFLLADLGESAGGVFALARDGSVRPFCEAVDGVALPPTNFVFEDDRGRVWITVSTRRVPRARRVPARTSRTASSFSSTRAARASSPTGWATPTRRCSRRTARGST